MKRAALLLALLALPAAALAPRGISVLEVLRAAAVRVQADSSIVTTPQGGVRCIPFAAGDSATGKVVTRISGVYCDVNLGQPGGDEECVIEVQAPASPVDPTTIPGIPAFFSVPDPNAVVAVARASALFPACQVAGATMAKAQSAGLFPCACWDGAGACTNTDPVLGTIACVRGVTLPAGSGAGAVTKACTVRAGPTDNSWPAACPLP